MVSTRYKTNDSKTLELLLAFLGSVFSFIERSSLTKVKAKATHLPKQTTINEIDSMVSFNDRPTIQLIPYHRNSAYDLLFWKQEELAEFRAEAQMEKAGITREMLRKYKEQHRAREVERERLERSSPAYYSVRAYNRPDEWIPLNMRPGKIGYATRIKKVSAAC
jgi:hypothetical protein